MLYPGHPGRCGSAMVNVRRWVFISTCTATITNTQATWLAHTARRYGGRLVVVALW